MWSGLVEAMSQPSFYPHEPARRAHRNPHLVGLRLVAGDLVYKIKKPAVFAFLDYGTFGTSTAALSRGGAAQPPPGRLDRGQRGASSPAPGSEPVEVQHLRVCRAL